MLLSLFSAQTRAQVLGQFVSFGFCRPTRLRALFSFRADCRIKFRFSALITWPLFWCLVQKSFTSHAKLTQNFVLAHHWWKLVIFHASLGICEQLVKGSNRPTVDSKWVSWYVYSNDPKISPIWMLSDFAILVNFIAKLQVTVTS